ncbi:thioredoxin family protein [Acidomonas methanolica]|uniref:thioredoxin family protein n=1 Tax=Acidomonas methanolica TaxID=437 RepID=UPI00211A501F|nr:thioredoxin family protein [Acidomonas methanolica]MCQ9156545.1 thioredoxin family protein [Acidomonas methanolica]
MTQRTALFPRFGALLAGLVVVATSIPGAGHAAEPPPGSVPVPQLDASQPITPAQHVYPDAALAHTQVTEAFKTALRTHRKVLLDFGGNWCPDCLKLAGVFDVPSVAQWLDAEFVVVPVNVERINQNLDIATRYGVTIHEVPTVLIFTANGKLLNADGANTLGNARAMSAQSVIDLLASWNRRS